MAEPIQLTELEARTLEVAQYEKNIQRYQIIIAALPSEYPAHLQKYRGAKNTHEAIAEVEDMDDVDLLSDLWAHDSAKAAIRAETVELKKSRAILSVLQAEQL